MKRLLTATGLALALTTTAQADDFEDLIERLTIGAVAADQICASVPDKDACYTNIFEGVGVSRTDVENVMSKFGNDDPALQQAAAATIIELAYR